MSFSSTAKRIGSDRLKAAVRFVTVGVLTTAVTLSPAVSGNDAFLLSGSNMDWPSVIEESEDIRTGRFIPRKILISGVQMDETRAYVTMPQYMKTGVSWSLGVFRLDPMDFEPAIQPFPDYKYYGSCSDTCIVNVVAIFLENGVLWALDSGKVNTIRRPIPLRPPQLLAIDLKTDTVDRAIDLQPVTSSESTLQHIVAQRTLNGHLFVFISDATRRKIIVYNVNADALHVVPLPEAMPPAATTWNVMLHLFTVNKAGKSFVYFTYQKSPKLYALESWSNESIQFGSMVEIGLKPTAMVFFSSDGGTNVYFRLPHSTEVYAWDANTPLDIANFRLVHRSYLYLTPTAVVAGWRDTLWSMESNYDEYVLCNVDCTGPRTLLRPVKTTVDDCDSYIL
ncbi:uncharacterized protein LOC126837382 [Adelges cooleyi]|uniref:uncharacterized protein LOC126837382 n=1 Tax=Adelges cooleyi TaxID=133065 RepID=UPI00217FD4A7|nr:uncharacterized protein LOC126837382 [Adelges cooleyi]